MIQNSYENPDAWIDEVRIRMYEDLQRLGQEEYDRQMDVSVRKVAEEFGLTMAGSTSPTRVSKELKQMMQQSSAMAANAV